MQVTKPIGGDGAGGVPPFHRPAIVTDSRPEAIHASIEGTLRRLRTDYVDLYYQHRIDPKVEPETVAEVRHPPTPRLEQET